MGSGGFSFLESTTAFLGGSEATYSLPGTKTNNNLVGCLKKVTIFKTLSMHIIAFGQVTDQFLEIFRETVGWK